MRVERFGYRLHGHDVKVTVCIETVDLVDLSRLHDSLKRVASRFDHRPLWESICLEDPMLEHLASRILLDLLSNCKVGSLSASWVEVEVPEGRIIVSGEEAARYYGVASECS